MGSNMQRQAVPLIRPETPIVGTGLEAKLPATRVSRFTLKAKVSWNSSMPKRSSPLRPKRNSKNWFSFEEDLKIYKLTKFIKTNQETCINLKPAVKKGQKVKEGDS